MHGLEINHLRVGRFGGTHRRHHRKCEGIGEHDKRTSEVARIAPETRKGGEALVETLAEATEEEVILISSDWILNQEPSELC